jgi:hypothetical protein
MVKGVTRRVIVIKSPDPKIFDEAIFIVKEDVLHKAVTQEEVIKEARETANQYINKHIQKKLLSRIPAPAFAALGAGLTAAIWLISTFA